MSEETRGTKRLVHAAYDLARRSRTLRAQVTELTKKAVRIRKASQEVRDNLGRNGKNSTDWVNKRGVSQNNQCSCTSSPMTEEGIFTSSLDIFRCLIPWATRGMACLTHLESIESAIFLTSGGPYTMAQPKTPAVSMILED